jgi:hypothetical protein
MQWKVYAGKRVHKQVDALPKRVKDSLLALMVDIQFHGPVRGNWPNYGKLTGGRHHCHITKRQTDLCGGLGRNRQNSKAC